MSRQAGASVHARTRLQKLAQQWRPTPAPSDDPRPADVWAALRDDGSDPALASWDAQPATQPAGIRFSGWTSSALRGLILIVAAAVALSAWWWWSGRPREAIAAPLITSSGVPVTGLAQTESSASAVSTDTARDGDAPASTGGDTRVVVHVVGQVKHPGLVTLPRGSRVADAIDAAGGVTKPHAADSVNLARVLVDGEQVIVGFAAQAVAGALGIGGGAASGVASGALLNLNSADAAALENLPGVGPVLAQRIVQWRTTNGPFRSVDELGEVSGIGDSIMSQIRPLVTV